MATTTHTIDATGEHIGRVASRAAHFLMGKDDPSFVRNKTSAVSVVIENASKLSIDERKRKQKIYVRYSGYPGGKKEEPLERVLERKGVEEVLRRAIYGMLPANKLRTERMKLLQIKD